MPRIVQLSLFESKHCTKCGENKPLSAFNPRSDNGKLRPWCVECNRRYKQQHRAANREMYGTTRRVYYAAHRERIRAQQKRDYDANPEKFREWSRQFREQHPDKTSFWARRSYWRHVAERRAKSRKWYRANKERALIHTHRRRARLVANGGTYTVREWRAMVSWFGDCCLCCGASERLTIDHVLPVARGGSNDIANLQPLCRPCNASKKARHIDYRDPVQLAEFLKTL